jgi:hypothetical protein
MTSHSTMPENTGETAMLTSKSKRRDGSVLAEFADVFASLKHMFDAYRPERHYMRGPGPAWHAKHAMAS